MNLAVDDGGRFHFPPFTAKQITLTTNILQRYPDTSPIQVLGRSDIAVGIKSDPGAKFPWEMLHRAGIGAWYDKEQKNHYIERFEKEGLPSQNQILE